MPTIIKCLTLYAHWAEAIFALGKDVENRSRPTDYRGVLAIHAGTVVNDAMCRRLRLKPEALTRGAIIGVVDLVDCVRTSKSKWARRGDFHWLLKNPRRLKRPVPYIGKQGMYFVTLTEDLWD